jgi:hypothetical protein
VRILRAVPVGLGYSLKVEAGRPGAVEIQSLWFPGWKIADAAGTAAPILGPSSSGRIQLGFVKSGSYEIEMVFGNTPVRSAGALISWLSVILLFPAIWLIRRRFDDGAGVRRTAIPTA